MLIDKDNILWKPFEAIVPALVGSLLTGAGGGGLLYNAIFTPIIHVEIIPDRYDETKTAIEVSNAGNAAATKLDLTIRAPEEFSYDIEDSSENYTLKEIDPRTLRVHMDRFIHGEGSTLSEESPAIVRFPVKTSCPGL